jgi:hypothetical protein
VCPRCEGEFTEIVSLHDNCNYSQPDVLQLSGDARPNDDLPDLVDDAPQNVPLDFGSFAPPRSAPPFEPEQARRMRTPFDQHDPWRDVPDPEEGDISTWNFNTPGGGRGTFSWTSRTYTTTRGGPNAFPQPFMFGNGPAFGQGFGGFGGFGGQARGPPQPGNMQDLFSAVFSTMQQAQMQHANQGNNAQRGTFIFGTGGNGAAQPPGNPFDLLSAIFNPQNARAGDAVFSQEAFDRILEQLAEQGHNAPPPASEDAIRSLPKKKIEKEDLGEDGKAECSICMDNVEIGTEVTFLPCNHWFHEACVVAWLKEHDTCPHCRQPISGQQNATGSGSRQRRPSRRSSSISAAHPSRLPEMGSNNGPENMQDRADRLAQMWQRRNEERDRARDGMFGRRTSSPQRRSPIEPSPAQYYGGTHESPDYYSGRPEPSRRRSSRPESQRSSNGNPGMWGWVRDHLPGGGGNTR